MTRGGGGQTEETGGRWRRAVCEMLPLLRDSLGGSASDHAAMPKHLADQCTWPRRCCYLGSATSIWMMVSRSTWSSCICLTAPSNFCWSDGSVTPI